MWNWLAENLATVLICIGLAAVVTGILVHLVREKKRGKTGCGCGCGSCPMSGSCGGSARGNGAKNA